MFNRKPSDPTKIERMRNVVHAKLRDLDAIFPQFGIETELHVSRIIICDGDGSRVYVSERMLDGEWSMSKVGGGPHLDFPINSRSKK